MMDLHINRLRELAKSLEAHRREVGAVSDEIAQHRPGPSGQPDEAYEALGLRLQEARAAVRKDEQDARLTLGWIAGEMGLRAPMHVRSTS